MMLLLRSFPSSLRSRQETQEPVGGSRARKRRGVGGLVGKSAATRKPCPCFFLPPGLNRARPSTRRRSPFSLLPRRDRRRAPTPIPPVSRCAGAQPCRQVPAPTRIPQGILPYLTLPFDSISLLLNATTTTTNPTKPTDPGPCQGAHQLLQLLRHQRNQEHRPRKQSDRSIQGPPNLP